jgi:hypothetical protein
MIRNVIKQILLGENLESILEVTLNRIYTKGPIETADLEILSYFAKYRPETLHPHLEKLLWFMGAYYKMEGVKPSSMMELVQQLYGETIKEAYGVTYTPVQAQIVDKIDNNSCFSFSAPTSTGKSFVFRKLIADSLHDVVVFVPSRALINEYYLTLNKAIPEKTVNILTFVDKINTSRAKRTIFILTPERSSELFNRSQEFDVDLFLFDEAQLGDELNVRGLYYDSVVRRAQKYYPNSKCVFAHPFVDNPAAQITKNHFSMDSSAAVSFKQKSVGQLFYAIDKTGAFYHVGVDINVMGQRHPIYHDPIEETLLQGGTVLFYVPKSKIILDNVYRQFKKYIDLCRDIEEETIRPYQDKLKQYTGGTNDKRKPFYSTSLDLIKKGVVVHHGSLPLKVRAIIEDFTNAKLCRICFATSTLEQGINMPFDLVYIDRFESSKPLAIKNLIGRAGRSTTARKFDYGKVVLKYGNVSAFRKIMKDDCTLATVSLLERESKELGPDFNDFKTSILDGTYMEDFNMTQSQFEALSDDDIQKKVQIFLGHIFKGENLISRENFYKEWTDQIYTETFCTIYESHLGRQLTGPEKKVLETAIHILYHRMYFGSFSTICRIRYNQLCRSSLRRKYEAEGRSIRNIKVCSMMGYSDLPNLKLNFFNLVDTKTPITDVDFDTVVYDTYDYLDKLIGFRLSDIFYAAFIVQYNKTGDVRAKKFANFIKYGTSNESEIYMIRYGLSLEDARLFLPFIEKVDETGIVVKDEFYNIPEEDRKPLERFV